MAKNSIYTRFRILITLAVFIIISCANFKAYFNTYYNAEAYFEKAEKIRLQTRGDKLPQTAVKNYDLVIKKSRAVLDEYPDFKLKKSALSLISQSHFHRGELRAANGTLGEMKNEFGNDVFVEVEFWTSLIKWKQGKPQPAINGLNELLNHSLQEDMEAKVYLAIAEILLEQDMQTEAMDNLEKAAENIRDPNEKGQIYYRIAELSFNDKDYDRALSGYNQVIKNSQSKKQIQEGHLKTVQIYRLNGDLDLATNSIKNMLLDESYKSIFPSLELELVKLFEQQNLTTQARNRLETIIQEYPKTIVSAEAFYILGNYSIFSDWNLEEALKQFGSVGKENNKSPYVEPAKLKIKEIGAYQKSKLDFEPWFVKITELDTIPNFKLPVNEQDEIAKILYNITELEAFHFSRSDTALIYLDLLIQYAEQSQLLPKALYAKSMILEEKADSSISIALRNRIISEFPKTDYALAIIMKDDFYKPMVSTSDQKLLNAEDKWLNDPALAIDGYREILVGDTVSESSAKAAYFLAFQYDYTFIQADSAIKYYDWILKYHGNSEQAKPSQSRITILNAILSDTSTTNEN
ncbi:MAG: tetratricopeptide repeat protein [Candidatus Marinimicrobia bacterium]|jgi:tetratricopeptide (TPR) repeat protein|nr:tetratricopeptide repeat protein [Candidatus Neomarinimicrobiota bacterium]MBT3675791.1 tetratricopeptide repeat protein [Candidatus Neomarinimicrobiota bacterium]MBT3762953.1 tetratricopeptide repeat protein [Candidatus Neomarinimicrobiota bacterium]MBT4069100.1 tetratricopeptide repeat protein [Candidatus Neomarinimicrobiota bacterium]MBT4271486.1 tetratricopeptide repeat protein [Candidatus Neomarinimicrobiota bacterium]